MATDAEPAEPGAGPITLNRLAEAMVVDRATTSYTPKGRLLPHRGARPPSPSRAGDGRDVTKMEW